MCDFHGGKAPRVRQKAKLRVALTSLPRRWWKRGRRPEDVLLEALDRSAALMQQEASLITRKPSVRRRRLQRLRWTRGCPRVWLRSLRMKREPSPHSSWTSSPTYRWVSTRRHSVGSESPWPLACEQNYRLVMTKSWH